MVSELPLDDVRAEALLVEDRAGDRPESMSCHLALVAKPVQREKQGIVADGTIPAPTGKHKTTTAADCLELFQRADRLRRERYYVFGFHLHATCGHNPNPGVEVKLSPFGADQLIGTHNRQREQLQRQLRLLVAKLLVAINRAQ